MKRIVHGIAAAIFGVAGALPGLAMCYAAVFGSTFTETQTASAFLLAIAAYGAVSVCIFTMPKAKADAHAGG